MKPSSLIVFIFFYVYLHNFCIYLFCYVWLVHFIHNITKERKIETAAIPRVDTCGGATRSERLLHEMEKDLLTGVRGKRPCVTQGGAASLRQGRVAAVGDGAKGEGDDRHRRW